MNSSRGQTKPSTRPKPKGRIKLKCTRVTERDAADSLRSWLIQYMAPMKEQALVAQKILGCFFKELAPGEY